MSDVGWGWLKDVEKYGSPFDSKGDYQEIPFQSALSECKDFMHATHAMLYACDDRKLWDLYDQKAMIMMQMRFDGNLGFPGGLLDEGGETPIQALNRELQEEICLDTQMFKIKQEDHVISHKNAKKNMVTHFYAKQVSPEEFVAIEKNALTAKDWGVETYGTLRVPLYTMGDGFRGFPVFLGNRFAGNARDQLFYTIKTRGILSDEHLSAACNAYRKYMEQNSS